MKLYEITTVEVETWNYKYFVEAESKKEAKKIFLNCKEKCEIMFDGTLENHYLEVTLIEEA